MPEINDFVQGFLQQNFLPNLAVNDDLASHMIRLIILIVKNLSDAKLNAFKNASWTLELLGLQASNFKIRTRILKLINHILQYIDLQNLISISEFLHQRMSEVFTTDPKVIIENIDIIKYFNTLCASAFKLLNLLPLEKHNFTLFSNYINSFYQLGFESNLNTALVQVYENQSRMFDDAMVLKAERILGFGISYFKGLLDNTSIWMSDLLFSDRDIDQTGQAEEYLQKNIFTGQTIEKIFRIIVTKYLILTEDEIALWREDSLKFFLHMKYQSNEVKGNYLREKGRNLLAGIQFRFASFLDQFCVSLIEQLKLTSGQSLTLQQQLEKEAMLQVLDIRIHNDEGIDSLQFLQLLLPELKLQDNLIVKRKIIQLLSAVSDFEKLQSELNLQEGFVREIMRIFASQEGDDNDLCIKQAFDYQLIRMACVEYMKNFYNQQYFKVDAYSHFLGDVLVMCNSMILSTYTKNTEVMNEILELYRFIVEKYAAHASQQQHIQQLVQFLKGIWDFFATKLGTQISQEERSTDEKDTDEVNFALQSILRIMMQIIAQLPINELPIDLTKAVLTVSMDQAFYAAISKNVMLHEYAITQLIVILRRLNNLSLETNTPENHKQIQFEMISSYEADVYEEVNKYFLLIEEIFNSLSIISKVSQLPLQEQILTFVGKLLSQNSDTLSVIASTANVIRYLILLSESAQLALNQTLTAYIKQVVNNKLEDLGQVEDDEKSGWVTLASGVVSTLLLVKDYDTARDLTFYLMSNRSFKELVINQVSLTDDTSIILFAAYSLKILTREMLNEDLVSNVENIFKNHISSEVDNALNYDFRLNRDLMVINEKGEEELFFEIPEQSLIDCDYKEKVIKGWISREIELIREVASQL